MREEQNRRAQLRPNESSRALRDLYERTTPAERLRIGAELSTVGTTLAARGSAMRRANDPAALRAWEVLRLLREQGVALVVIGGFAVQYHGYVRATKDVDVVPDPSRDNMGRLSAALRTVSKRRIDVSDGNTRVLTELGVLNVMSTIPGAGSYEELRAGAVEEMLPEVGYTVAFAGFDDLITMKEEAGRESDRIDLTSLRLARGLEE
jgi:hypothetical protein